MSGDGRPSFAEVSRAARAAACIIALPPDAWTLIIHAPVCDRGLNRLLHGIRDVVVLEVEEDTGTGIHQRVHELGSFAGEQAVADLESTDDAAECSRPVPSHARPLSTSSATRS